MKTNTLKIVTLIIGMILISSSCTIQKRRYLKGYYVSWNKNFNSKHQAPKTTQLNVNKNIKKINLTTPATGINMPKKVEIKTLTKRKITSNHLKNKNVKKSTKSTLKNKINPNKIETKQKYITDVVTDSTTTNNELTKNETELIKNEKATNALIVFILSIWLFVFGGFIAIIFSYFLAIKALNQIRDQPNIYRKKEKKRALTVIILYNIFAFALLITTSIIMFFDTLIFIFFIAGIVYGLCAIIGLIILRNKSLERKHKNEQKMQGINNKKPIKQLAVFLFLSILALVLYYFYG